MGKKKKELFSVRQKIRRWKLFSGIFHLITVSSFALSLLWVLPQLGSKSALQLGQEVKAQQERRQLLLEVLDKMARYQKYFNEVHGRYTRDLSRLLLPENFASGELEGLHRSYEISVLETAPNRFLLLATGVKNSDRVTIDESHRVNSNFVLPAPSRAYLHEEADRLLRLRSSGQQAVEGVVARYWKVQEEEGRSWVAMGLRNPVAGEKREIRADSMIGSIFDSIRGKMQNRLASGFSPGRSLASAAPAKENSFKEILSASDVSEWLEKAHLAQHIHLREKGRFARRWEELDAISDYKFTERMRSVKNVRVHPIELQEEGYQLTLEGTEGELLGERFQIDRTGSLRQVRYTEALIEQLQETTNLLENFQINPIFDDAGGKLRP